MHKKTFVKFLVHLDSLNLGLGRNAVGFADGGVRFKKRQAIFEIHFKGVFPCEIMHSGKVNHFGRAKRFLQSR